MFLNLKTVAASFTARFLFARSYKVTICFYNHDWLVHTYSIDGSLNHISPPQQSNSFDTLSCCITFQSEIYFWHISSSRLSIRGKLLSSFFSCKAALRSNSIHKFYSQTSSVFSSPLLHKCLHWKPYTPPLEGFLLQSSFSSMFLKVKTATDHF